LATALSASASPFFAFSSARFFAAARWATICWSFA